MARIACTDCSVVWDEKWLRRGLCPSCRLKNPARRFTVAATPKPAKTQKRFLTHYLQEDGFSPCLKRVKDLQRFTIDETNVTCEHCLAILKERSTRRP